MYSHATMTVQEIATGLPRSERGIDPAGGPRRLRVGIVGATGYVGGELVRLLARHPNVELVGLVGSPGCYPTATLLALAPLARAGLIGDLVVDAKSGVSGAGRELRPGFLFGEVNESVSAYGVGGHRHVAEIEQELAWITGG